MLLVVINPTCDEPFVFFPTGFSPNGDGENDVLRVEGTYITEINWLIYNRWGEAIFEAKLPTDEWDGTFLGEKLPPDTYAFYLRVKCTGGSRTHPQGKRNAPPLILLFNRDFPVNGEAFDKPPLIHSPSF